MAYLVNRLNLPLLSVYGAQSMVVRNASKKTGTSTRNTTKHGRPKHRGWKVQDGHWVESGTLLATQKNLRFHPGLNISLNNFRVYKGILMKLGMSVRIGILYIHTKFHQNPLINTGVIPVNMFVWPSAGISGSEFEASAGVGKNLTIFALTSGRVMVTCEKPDLDWDHNFVKMFYEGRNVQGLHKKYFNVIPEPQHQNFKLVEQI